MTHTNWSAAQYATFLDERTRPARDLLARVPIQAPARVVDLGCGPGNSTRVLRERFPHAELVGVDASPDMIATAQRAGVTARFELSDVTSWRAAQPVDVLFSNALLQWLPHHEVLLPALFSQLAPGGALAVQMPANFGAPSHALLRETANEARFVSKLNGVLREAPVAAADQYVRWLEALATTLEVWSTTYLHRLHGDDAVLEWVKGTALVPVRERLDAAEYAAFVTSYAAKLRAAYPTDAKGLTLFPFTRLFIVAGAAK